MSHSEHDDPDDLEWVAARAAEDEGARMVQVKLAYAAIGELRVVINDRAAFAAVCVGNELRLQRLERLSPDEEPPRRVAQAASEAQNTL